MTGYEGPTNNSISSLYSPTLRINDVYNNGTGYGNGQPSGNAVACNKGTGAFSGNLNCSTNQLFSFEWSCIDIPNVTTLAGMYNTSYAGPWRCYINGQNQQTYINDTGSYYMAGGWFALSNGRTPKA